ncbi:OmpP1/FadL family transporter [Hydrogenovibrio kuenenii]|uniref:OmpP1/FadL family transporter n=1 Tax=Hydrogenovibrio kuenenii TaxID=63658 RepID=UPI000465D113|nr:OmpP1/FadL family transporter [Hydrogenovibrio kuenenii]
MRVAYKLPLLLLFSAQAQASGFALIEQSASFQGYSYAGAAASAADASTIWFNPAGMTQIKGNQAILGAHLIVPKAKFTNKGSTTPLSTAITGSGEDGATIGLVPNIYWKGQYGAYDVGLGISVPFGQEIKYSDKSVLRYHATTTDLKSLNINPSIARKINDKWSVGLGLNAQYVHLIMENQVDVGTALGSPYTYSQKLDGHAKLTADSWAYGYNLGVLFKPAEQTHIGFSYRSQMSHHAKGNVKFTDINAAAASSFPNTGVSSTVNLPASAMLSLTQGISPNMTVLADATWTGWKAYDSLVIHYDQAVGGKTQSSTNQHFKDVMRYSLGLKYQMSDRLKLRTGVAVDETPVPNAASRTPRTPDSTRKWVSAGFGYEFSPKMGVDVAYSHLFADRSDVNYNNGSNYILKGYYDSSVDIVSAQFRWNY